jgi:hypothetical protein
MSEKCNGYMLLASDRETADLHGVRRLASGPAEPLPELMQGRGIHRLPELMQELHRDLLPELMQELHRDLLPELMQALHRDLLKELRVPPSACLHARRASRFR